MSEAEIVIAMNTTLVLGLGFGGNGCLEAIFTPLVLSNGGDGEKK